MAYPYYGFNNYPNNYQNLNMNPNINPINQGYQQPQQDDRIWVQNRNAAEAYLVAPNSFVRLWDNNANVFYEKRADASGRIYMDTYSYKREGADLPNKGTIEEGHTNTLAEKVTALESKIQGLEKELEALKGGSVNE